ncbi:hypothetical protein GCK32_010032 [Trichostrongylus colubriformis]|uniref:Uncharacterized protein n=1 Tax=Trichostrongylus colubriformis TaxID=6319 RepID=A0AAN8EYA8_TRICO
MESQLISKREAQDKDVLMENRKAVTAHLKSMVNNVLKEEITVDKKMVQRGMYSSVFLITFTALLFPFKCLMSMVVKEWNEIGRCRVLFQIGDSDQLSDSNSAHYIERTCGEKFAAVGTDSAGNKLGKSVGGGDVWRRAVLSSSFHFYQFLHQLHDAEGEQMCELYRLNEYVRSLRRVKLVTLFGNTIKVARNEMGDLVDRTRPDSVKGSALMTEGAIKVNGEKTIDNTTPSFSSG